MRRGLFALLLVAACARGAKDPDEGAGKVRAAVAAGDATSLYRLLDKPTLDSIGATFKYHQQCLAAIEEAYPADVQAREKARFVDADDSRAFFAAYEARYRGLAALAPNRDEFVQEGSRWMYSGLRVRWEDIKQRASHDVDTVRESAAAYKKAGK